MSLRAFAAFGILASLAPPLPEGCNKLLGRSAASTESTSASSASATAPSTAAASATSTATSTNDPSAPTAPPIWTPPEPSTGAAPPPSPNEVLLGQARAAAGKKEWKKVKTLLDKRMKSGEATREEVELMQTACEKTRDKGCLETLRKAYGNNP